VTTIREELEELENRKTEVSQELQRLLDNSIEAYHQC